MPVAEFPGTAAGVAPRSYSPGRPYGGPLRVVIHDTEGSESGTAAEDGNAYDARRGDGTSAHAFGDGNSLVQEVNSWDRAHSARSFSNNRDYHFEICGRAAQTLAQWRADPSGADFALLGNAARHVAEVCRKLGIPARWVTRAQYVAGERGLCTHGDLTAWGIDGNTHTDPGPNFPRTAFLDAVQAHLNPGGDDMDGSTLVPYYDVSPPAGLPVAQRIPYDAWCANMSSLQNGMNDREARMEGVLAGIAAGLAAMAAGDNLDTVVAKMQVEERAATQAARADLDALKTTLMAAIAEHDPTPPTPPAAP